MRDRRGQVLFIDARKLGMPVDRTRKELSNEDIATIATAYHAWRGEPNAGDYVDVPGFCKRAKLDEIRGHDHVLTPGRYVGAADIEDAVLRSQSGLRRSRSSWRSSSRRSID